MAEALFVREGDRYTPTERARGPWDPRALHGGPPAALLAVLIEGTEPAMPLRRLTVEFLRPVPLSPLTARITLVRPGRRVSLVEGSLRAEETEVVRAVGLRLRSASLDVENGTRRAPPDFPERGHFAPPFGDWTAFHTDGVELRPVGEPFSGPGRGTAWIRLRLPIVEGEEPTPAARAVAAADFGNGISPALDPREHLFINPDLTVHLDRRPDGEWVCLEATTRIQPDGVGLAESALFDHRGPIGRSLQTLLVDRR